ncbi:MAG: FtsW/RodA/SpoVE family cell cycle protein, partial [Syntrophales bacterium]|nr:FtsW/RodA/SpoVE family cell cycle protein [Syntrophales bacterium]
MKFDRRLFLNFDWTLLSIVLFISFIGILNIYSTGYSLPDFKQSPLYIKQIQWILAGLVFMVIALSIDYRLISDYAYIIHTFAVFLLAGVFLYGTSTHGSQRWIVLGGFSFQPSELVKLTMILALARYFDDHKTDKTYRLRDLFVPFLIVAIPFLLILKQPDLGTALMVAIIFLSMALFVGIEWKSLACAVAGCVVLIPVGWHFLEDYQKERIATFFNPERDFLGS